MKPHREPSIRRDTSTKVHVYVRAGGQLRFGCFPVDTPLEAVRRWRLDTRTVAEHRQQLEWWTARLGDFRRDAVTPADVRAALAELRQTHAASTSNH